MQNKLLLALIFVGLLLAPYQSHANEENAPSWCVSVWYPSSPEPTGYTSIMNNLDAIHEVNPFWYAPHLDGSLILYDGAEDAEKLAEWKEAGLAIIPTIATTAASTMIEDSTIRAIHIATIVNLVEQMEYDGIDIDYEGFALHTRDVFSTFIEELSIALHENGKLLSIAVHAKTADVGQWDAATAQDWVRLASAVDIFKIMTYDYHNRASDAGPIAPVQWVTQVVDYAATVTDLSKVRLGLPFYGYSWTRSTVSVISWQNAHQWVDSFDLTITRDEADMEARLDLDLTGLPKQTVYFADSVSLSFKLNMILEAYPTLGGVAIWGLGGEDPANWDILRGLQRACTFFDEN